VGSSLINLRHFGHIFGTTNLLKTHIIAELKKNIVKKMALGVGVQGPMTSS